MCTAIYPCILALIAIVQLLYHIDPHAGNQLLVTKSISLSDSSFSFKIILIELEFFRQRNS